MYVFAVGLVMKHVLRREVMTLALAHFSRRPFDHAMDAGGQGRDPLCVERLEYLLPWIHIQGWRYPTGARGRRARRNPRGRQAARIGHRKDAHVHRRHVSIRRTMKRLLAADV